MTLRVEDYAPKLPSSEVERELVAELKNLPKDERWRFLMNLMYCGLPHCFPVAVRLAQACLKEQPSFGKIHVEDYAPKLRDTKVEKELASEVKNLPEAERLQFINDLMYCGLPHCFPVALWLAKTCLKERESLEAILNQGLERGDASTVKYWIETVIHGLGFRRVVRLVSERIATDPESVIRAEYHLRKWIPKDNQKAADAFAALQQAVEQIMRDDPTIEARVRPFKTLMKKLD